jgi:hypothetical protein
MPAIGAMLVVTTLFSALIAAVMPVGTLIVLLRSAAKTELDQ